MLTIERFKKAFLIAPFLVLIFLARGVLFEGNILYDGDTARTLYQYLNYLSHDDWLINPYILSGFPIFVSTVAGWFYPVYGWTLAFFDAFDSYRFLIIANISLSCIFAYLYARAIGFNHAIAATVSTVFVFSGQMLAWFTTLTNTNYYFILPAVLFFAEFVRRKRHRPLFLVLTGLFLGASWLSGHSQFVLYIHAFLAAYYLYWAFMEGSLKSYLEHLLNMAVAYGISLIVGWPQIRAILDFQGVTARSGGLSLSDFLIGSYLPQDIIHYILPFFQNPIIQLGSPNLYIGILPFLLLVFAFLVFKKIKDRHFYLYLGTFVFCLLASIRYSPIGFLLHELPPFDALRVGTRIMFVGNFAAAVVVGFVLKYITENREEASERISSYLNILKKIFLCVFTPVVIVGSVAKVFFAERILAFINNYFLDNLYKDTSGLPVEHYLGLLSQYLNDSLDSIFILNWDVATFVIFGVLAFYLLKRIREFKPEAFLTLSLIAISLNFAFAYANRFETVSREELTSFSKTAEFIQNNDDLGQFRIFTPFSGITIYNNLRVACASDDVSEELLLQKELITPSLNMQFGIDSIDGYDPFMPLSVAEMIGYVGSEHTTASYSLAWEAISLEDRIKKFIDRKNILKSMNVKYVISAYDIDDEDFTKVFSEEVGECRTPVNIYELSDYWPRNFVTTDLSLLDSENDFKKTIERLEGASRPAFDDAALVSQSYGYDSIDFEVVLETDGLLFIGNTWLPSWRAYVDGKEVEILKANYVYMALPLLKGEHRVVLKYTR